MNNFRDQEQIFYWLNQKFINRENGIIFNDLIGNSFNTIQEFIENCDHPRKTPIIYYEAFPEESALQFMTTLREELSSKLGIPTLTTEKSLSEIVRLAELQTIIIDRCHLHPWDTFKQLLQVFDSCQVAVILVGDQPKMEISQILELPTIANWDRLTVHEIDQTFGVAELS